MAIDSGYVGAGSVAAAGAAKSGAASAPSKPSSADAATFSEAVTVASESGATAAAAAAPVEVTVTEDSKGRTVVDAGNGNDLMEVSQRSDGGLDVTTNGELTSLTTEQSQNVVLRAGSGSDGVFLDDSVTQGVRIEGGSGDDVLYGGSGRDVIHGNDGRDYVDAGGGNDLVFGGDGRDTLYGLDGNDLLEGGADNDYIDGGEGNDRAYGQGGDDVVSGGQGNDIVTGREGNDVLITGAGDDWAEASAGPETDTDTVFADTNDRITTDGNDNIERLNPNATNAAGDPLGSSVTATGSDRFVDRVNSDLDTLRSLPEGQSVLEALDATGYATQIGGNGFPAALPTNPDPAAVERQADGTPGPGSDALVGYNPTASAISDFAGGTNPEPWMTFPPIVTLEHELLHALDFGQGTIEPGDTNVGTATAPQLVPNAELSVTGLPYDQDGDLAGDTNNRTHTEAAFRAQLGLDARTQY